MSRQAIEEIINKYKLEISIYVGDTEGDYMASLDSYSIFVYAKYGFGKGLTPKYQIDNISELPKLIDKIIYEK